MISIPESYIKIDDLIEMQQLLYYLTDLFHEYCEQHNLIYNLYGGSLLGAVRHGAIIPWDDDVDLSMPREDYERLINLIKDDASLPFIVMAPGDVDYVYPFAKIVLKDSLLVESRLRPEYRKFGLYLDIFPIDGFGNVERYNDIKKYGIGRINSVMNMEVSPVWWKKPYAVIRACQMLPCRLKGYNYYLDLEIKAAKSYPFETSDEVCCVAGSWYEKGRIQRNTYLDRCLYPFGRINCWGIKKYQQHLGNLYGDYMKLPHENERAPHHTYDLYIDKELFEKIIAMKY